MENQNEQYIESMGQAFDEYKAGGNIAKCRYVIEELKSNGFTNEANSLIDELYDIPLSQFTDHD